MECPPEVAMYSAYTDQASDANLVASTAAGAAGPGAYPGHIDVPHECIVCLQPCSELMPFSACKCVDRVRTTGQRTLSQPLAYVHDTCNRQWHDSHGDCMICRTPDTTPELSPHPRIDMPPAWSLDPPGAASVAEGAPDRTARESSSSPPGASNRRVITVATALRTMMQACNPSDSSRCC